VINRVDDAEFTSGGTSSDPARSLAVALGQRIVRARRRRGWSQTELAGKLEITRERMGNWERGEHLPPLEALARLGLILRVSLDELVHGRRRGRWLTEDETGQVAQLLAGLGDLLG
jgi:transcriptional regulator with XRE-family HTH domain